MKDSKIIELILKGDDRKAIKNLYSEVFPNVSNYIVRNNGSKAEAEDCFQEAITKFYRQVLSRTFDKKYHIHGYLYTISLRLWLNQIKKNKRQVPLDNIDLEYKDLSIEQAPLHIQENKQDKILEILNRLGAKCKELLYQTIFSDLVNEDIMQRFEYSSIGAVKMQHKRCKEKLVELIKNEPSLVKSFQNG